MPSPSDYGVEDGGGVFDVSKLAQFVVDHPEWEGVGEPGSLSYESGVLAWDQGAPSPEHWESVTVVGDGDTDEWSVLIVTDEGTFLIDVGDSIDRAFDYYDGAAWYDYDNDKDITSSGDNE